MMQFNEWLHCLTQVKLYKIVVFIFLILICVPLLTHFYLSALENIRSSSMYDTDSGRQSGTVERFYKYHEGDLQAGVEDILRVKGLLLNELINMEKRQKQLERDILSYNRRIDTLKEDIVHQQTGLSNLKISVEQAKLAYNEALEKNSPDLAPPAKLVANEVPDTYPTMSKEASLRCLMHTCFDHFRCSIASGFPVYMYDPDRYSVLNDGWDVDGFLKMTLKQALGYNAHVTNDPKEACIYLVLIGETMREVNDVSQEFQSKLSLAPINSDALQNLPYWGGDGRNHLLMYLARRDLSQSLDDMFASLNTGKAMLVQSTFHYDKFRPGFDLITVPILGPPGGDVWQECGPMVPARRKYLLTFQGEITEPNETGPDVNQQLEAAKNLSRLLTSASTSDEFLLEFKCSLSSDDNFVSDGSDWNLCGTDSSRKAILKQSTFVLIFGPTSRLLLTSTILQARLYEALRAGAIPIVLGGDQIRFAYSEVLDWRRATISFPRSRISELHFLLRSIPDEDLLMMRRQGRFLWERYLASVQTTLDTILAVVRQRLHIPPPPIDSFRSQSIFNSTGYYQSMNIISTQLVAAVGGAAEDIEQEESLGPIEPPFDSPPFRRNYSLFLTQGYEIWNSLIGDPFRLYPSLPSDPVLPSDAKFIGSSRGFRPIGRGQGGAGKEFSEALGGNYPKEQYTILMLTYEREQVLVESIARLRGLPYLNAIVVIWNSPRMPNPELRWPDIGVPLHVVKVARNSLNNRFLPLDIIHTEAVLSIDDDAHLRHDEILFAFRVWREARHRIVGFPGRYHAWDLNTNSSWLYNSNYSCELSMVLTGAAFIHRHYLMLYWKWLPQAIRDKVDEYMNCEDIAMNFLVSHITRLPPLKVTSRWTFRCPGCSQSLSEDETHFQERHKCINYFAQIFGYTPLLNTQFRADSILFKTRIPHEKQKCFRFI